LNFSSKNPSLAQISVQGYPLEPPAPFPSPGMLANLVSKKIKTIYSSDVIDIFGRNPISAFLY